MVPEATQFKFMALWDRPLGHRVTWQKRRSRVAGCPVPGPSSCYSTLYQNSAPTGGNCSLKERKDIFTPVFCLFGHHFRCCLDTFLQCLPGS